MSTRISGILRPLPREILDLDYKGIKFGLVMTTMNQREQRILQGIAMMQEVDGFRRSTIDLIHSVAFEDNKTYRLLCKYQQESIPTARAIRAKALIKHAQKVKR